MPNTARSIDSIFRRAKQGRILFLDRTALSPEYVPDRLPFRDEEIRSVAEVLAPALHNSKPSNLLLYGKTGTGKTAVARYVQSKLRNEDPTDKIMTPYVNTRIAGTEYRTLTELGTQIGLSPKEIPFTGLSSGELVNRIFKAIQSNGSEVVFVLDEIDYLVASYGDGLLYEFTRAGDRIAPGFLSIVGVSNNLRFKEALDARVLSSLGEEELVFPPYTVQELRAILAERSKIAFRPGVIKESTINLCAAIAGAEHGDARRAVDLLRIAGEVAEREGLQAIEESCINKASEKAEHDRVEEALRSLPVQTKIILLAVAKFRDGTNTGELYLAYTSFIKKAGLEPLTQRRLSGILAELDLLGLVQAQIVSKGRRGRTKRIKSLVDNAILIKTFGDDTQLLELT